jgi:hypothetical protein
MASTYGKKKAKIFWFSSARCAELLLMQRAVLGSGEQLREYCSRQGETSNRDKGNGLLSSL